MKFTYHHLALLLRFSEDNALYTKLSANRQRLANELVAKNLMRIDEEEYVYTTEKGNKLIDNIVTEVNKFLS